jgi:hypothetical protein
MLHNKKICALPQKLWEHGRSVMFKEIHGISFGHPFPEIPFTFTGKYVVNVQIELWQANHNRKPFLNLVKISWSWYDSNLVLSLCFSVLYHWACGGRNAFYRNDTCLHVDLQPLHKELVWSVCNGPLSSIETSAADQITWDYSSPMKMLQRTTC